MVLILRIEVKNCDWKWADYVKLKLNGFKRKHWFTFLAKSKGNLTFKAFAYTKTLATGEVAPLYRDENSLATEKNEQAEFRFAGKSVSES